MNSGWNGNKSVDKIGQKNGRRNGKLPKGHTNKELHNNCAVRCICICLRLAYQKHKFQHHVSGVWVIYSDIPFYSLCPCWSNHSAAQEQGTAGLDVNLHVHCLDEILPLETHVQMINVNLLSLCMYIRPVISVNYRPNNPTESSNSLHVLYQV